MANIFLIEQRRWLHPIGPAPVGWVTISGCSHTIPHDEYDEQWMNEDMNKDHLF